MIETFTFPQFSPDRSVVHVGLYTNIKNAAGLRKRIIGAAGMQGEEGDREREAVNFAFVDARLITSRLHLQTAIYQAILAESQNALRTRTVHSEVLWALNPTHNITEALRRYGVSETTTALFVVRIGGSVVPDIQDTMDAAVAGTLQSLNSMERLTDWAAIKEYYKLNDEGALRKPKDEKKVVDNIVISSVAMKSVMQ
ncbi:hypothetical protein Hypma_004011 [Hypsizygus marmoreus]|uniref:EKC/KEOPS complex subunit CGI121 n=1 Tax=Hypsizygus marmoreus TaxID=39966 RepID=A0A369J5D5_HYPMA|nr:hypothetical protein Hypma_004011 [Hypsizygus marmoreus]